MTRWHRLTILTCAVAQAVRAATNGSFTALSFNVAGLPQFLTDNGVPGDKAENTALIGTKFSEFGFDIIHVQEDFNYHRELYEHDVHPFRTTTSGGIPIGSGLNTLSYFPWADFARITWDACSIISAADCLTPKGFTFMRLQIDEGVYIDAYNVHADAGSLSTDISARRSNIQQVANYIDTWSAGNAVLVFGDTNCLYTRDESITIFSRQNGLRDAWVQLVLGGIPPTVEDACGNPAESASCEILDKLFYRSSPLVSLNATSFKYVAKSFLQPDGSILSDHNPILVSFDWIRSSSLHQSTLFGGSYGIWFSDVPKLPKVPSPSGLTLTLRGASRVNSVGIMYADHRTFRHGGSGGSPISFTPSSGQYVKSVKLCQGEYEDRTGIFYFEATTSDDERLSVGTPTNDCETFVGESGWGLVGFVGRKGEEIHQLGLLWAPVEQEKLE